MGRREEVAEESDDRQKTWISLASSNSEDITYQAPEVSAEIEGQFVTAQRGSTSSLSDFLSAGAEACLAPAPETERAPFAPTTTFNGKLRFQIVRELGSGGFGSVYEAVDFLREETVAIKKTHRPEAEQLSAFRTEFRSFADLEHPNLVKLFELFDDGQHCFFSMELVEGIDFVSYVQRSPARLRPVAAQLAQTVHFLHRKHKTVHRDIKPSNILVTRQGKLKLLDFGLARDISRNSPHTQTIGGTAAYMAPEAMDRSLRRASDWYSVGAVLYEALTGEPPFQGAFMEILTRKNSEAVRPPRELNSEIPDDLNQLCVRLLDRNPAIRPPGEDVLQCLASPDLSATISDAEQPASGTVSLVGRESHLTALQHALRQVRRGHTACIHVKGISGMGKSELCREFLSNLDQSDALVLAGRCYQNETVPYKALDRVIESLAGYLKSLSSAEVEAVLPRERPLSALAHVFPTLGVVKTIQQARRDPGAEFSHRDLQRLAISALKEILARISQKRPCIVFIDDFQWGDFDSVDFLAGILGPPDPPCALFLFAYRSEDIGSDYAKHLDYLRQQQQNHDLYSGIFSELEVDRLEQRDCLRLVQQLIPSASEALCQRVYRESDGAPLFIHELALLALPAAGVSEGLSFPALIGNRMALLPDAARRMVEVVSLAGQPIGIDIVLKAAGIERSHQPSKSALERLVRFQGSTGASALLEPYHDKIRETIEASLPDDIKRKYFRALAAALENREGADPEIVYRYFRDAGDLAKARSYLKIAAQRAEAAMAFDLAVTLRQELVKTRSGDDPDRSELLELLAQALALAGHGRESAEKYKEAAQDALPRRQLELIRKAGEQYIRSGCFEEGQALLCGLLQKVGFRLASHRWQVMAALFARRAVLWFRGLDFVPKPDAEAFAEEGEKLDICRVASLALALQDPIQAAELQARHRLRSLRLGEPYRVANSLAMEAGYLAAKGGRAAYPAAQKLLARVEEFAAKSGHPNRTTLAISVRSKVAWLAGDWLECAKWGEEVNRIATEQYTRVAWEAYPSSIFWMCSLACMGRWRELMARLPGLEADSKARGDLLEKTSLPVFTFAYMRWLLKDDPEGASEVLRRAQERLDKPGFVPHRFGVYYGLAEVALYRQDPERAQRTVDQGWSELESAMALRLQPVRIFMLHLRARVACAAAASTDSTARRLFLQEAKVDARRIRREKTEWGNGLSSLIEASAAAAEGKPNEARRLLESAEQACLRSGMNHFVAVARHCKAQLLQGAPRDAAEEQAAIWFSEQGVVRRDRMAQMLAPGNWNSSL
jgi:eukaryotic-like serine/threonine-protein kinase